jgi:hypothetical protein
MSEPSLSDAPGHLHINKCEFIDVGKTTGVSGTREKKFHLKIAS